MAIRIAVTGKGDDGKTTISSMIDQYLLPKGLTLVLTMRVGFNMNPNQMLGVEV
jgi:CO dehydrogenase nickel-insertion accessory protein CooC1